MIKENEIEVTARGSCCMKGVGSRQSDKILSMNTADQLQCRLARCPFGVPFEALEREIGTPCGSGALPGDWDSGPAA